MSKLLMLPIEEVEALKAVMKSAVRDILNEMLQERKTEIGAFLREALDDSRKQQQV